MGDYWTIRATSTNVGDRHLRHQMVKCGLAPGSAGMIAANALDFMAPWKSSTAVVTQLLREEPRVRCR